MGDYILKRIIIDDYDIRNKKASSLFSLMFALSSNGFIIFIFEVFKIGENETRYIYWMFTLLILCQSSITIIPAIIIFKIVKKISKIVYIKICKNKIRNKQLNKQFYLIIQLILYLQILIRFFILYSFWLISTQIGIYFIAIVSGIGCVNCPYNQFNILYQNIQDIQQSKIQNEENLKYIINKIYQNKYNLLILNKKMLTQLPEQQKKQAIIFYLKQTYTESKNEVLIVIIFYIIVLLFFTKDYVELQTEIQKFQYSKSLKGKFFRFLSIIMGIYCIYKIFISTYNYIVGRKKSIDPINRILKVILPFIGIHIVDEHYDMAIYYLSFGFLGFLMVTNIRTFCLNIISILNMLMSYLKQNSIGTDLIVYFLAELQSIYFISTLILMQSNLAEEFSMNLQKITQNLNIYIHYKVFDLIFLISSISQIIFLVIYSFNKNKQMNIFKEDIIYKTD
ncbi:hypothetical protein IMG5_000860 [Ichthyophthirius multifiliis]|uniref:Uncharacterized protein n=1 Tax=Ichthyophthirius multifiliis TaxID=5932 RepID=G0QIX3_ICHMU|nr:hypothetical protein IMG5_000860 [Ichthyophthirius multifiliis]EGR34858.1 hypothetical protein IMG5_000860 [Ichthyophthirius multifiliis]|eukprot:XP_004040162.1 hypothetical protein IMG5_000860 [Ichthyophthirius multifiliis]